MGSSLRIVAGSTDRRKAQILKELRRLLAVEGVQGMTMRGLAASSGVATRTLFNLFGSKDALISASLTDMDQDVNRIILARSKPDTNPLDQLIDYIEVASNLIRNEPGYSNAIIYAYHSSDVSLVGFHRYFHDFKKVMFAEILSRMQRPGGLESWVSIDLLASRIAETHINVVAEWSRGLVRDDELVDSAVFALLTILIGHVGAAHEKRLIPRLSALGEKLGKKQPAPHLEDSMSPYVDEVRTEKRIRRRSN